MIQLLLSISLLLSSHQFSGQWILVKGSVDQMDHKVLIFEKFDPQIHTSFQEVYTIHEDGSFSLSLHNPQNLGFCGNGMLNISQGKWSLEDHVFRLQLSGERLAMTTWSLDRQYSIKRVGQQLILKPQGIGTFNTTNPYVILPTIENDR